MPQIKENRLAFQRNEPILQSMEYVFGYGSLLEKTGACATLNGWQRSWGVAMDNSEDLPHYKHYLDASGGRPKICVAFLDVQPHAAAEVNGVVIAVSREALAVLDARERNYRRVDVTSALSLDLEGKAWVYTGLEESVERCRRALEQKRLFVQKQYLLAVRAGFRALGEDSYATFQETTVLLPCPAAKLKIVRHTA